MKERIKMPELSTEMPLKKTGRGRPKKNVEVEIKPKKKMGKPKKVVNVDKPKSKRGRPKKVAERPAIHIYNEFEGLRNKLKEKLEGKKSAKNPLDAYTKKTNIIFDEPTISKERLALQISNEQVDSLKKTNQKLVEANNKYIAELADLKFNSELNSVSKKDKGLSMDKLEELIFTFLEKVQSNEDNQIISLRNQNANQTNTINELQGVIGNLTREIKDLKEVEEVSKKQFEKSVGKKVLSFFIAFVSGLIAAMIFMIALA